MNYMCFGDFMTIGGFLQKQLMGPLTYTPNKPTDDNK